MKLAAIKATWRRTNKFVRWGVVIGGAASARALWLWSSSKTGTPEHDRANILGQLVARCVLKWGPLVPLERVQALSAMLWREAPKGREASVGDAGDARGPSIGPGQVLRTTAIRLGLVAADTDYDAYETMASELSTWTLIGWSVAVFDSVLDDTGGDLLESIKLYNGPAGDTYRDEVIEFAKERWGGFWIAASAA